MTRSVPFAAGGVRLESFIPWRLVRRDCRKEVITPIDAPQAFGAEATQERAQRQQTPVTPLQRALGLAHHWQGLRDAQHVASLGEIAAAEGIDVTQVRRLLRLTLLAPDVIEGVFNDQHAHLEPMMRQAVPIQWDDQRRMVHRTDALNAKQRVDKGS